MSSIDRLDEGGVPWGALGMVGRSWDGNYVWCHDVDGPTAVCTLDSCFLVTRTDLRLWFDAGRFDEFHCFVEDYCLQCHHAGLGVWVVPVPVESRGSHVRQGGLPLGALRRVPQAPRQEVATTLSRLHDRLSQAHA